MRRTLLVVPLLLLAGCSGGGGDEDEPAGASPHGGATTPAATSWNPCDDVEPEEVGELLGSAVTEEDGEPGAMRCTYLPVEEGGPTLDVNYLWFDGSFAEAWETIGGDVAGRVSDLDLPTADAARTVVQVTDDAVVVTGFVQTGGLIESVNAIVLDPGQRDSLLRATRGLLRLLSERAPERAAG
ncbi:DUF3558 family protein [Nocardioides deserti]|uniref:DUF3558 family protein n=1 Tax=Nocardioides deserti TaxID=1588644 RepID=A0ABR6U5K1_9ACTN|nr:DUF3558 family protein [Nocardioides deserti]MBC2959675.1 DUF3558 family protein [Nocardioides deserti]GGO74236.1 hypothetical protein GCM10012276_21790 [Nocardioides deserti]